MKVDLSPYWESCRYIVEEVTGLHTEIGEIFRKNSPYSVKDITVVFGVVGHMRGQTTFSMSLDLGHKITSAMLAQSGLVETEEFVRSAISEFGNMVMGHTASAFYKTGMAFDITPPGILTGEQMSISVEKMDIVCIPVIFDDGEVMEINIAYKIQKP